MESRAGTPDGAGRFRPLNTPRPLVVEPDGDGAPLRVGGRTVASVEETWRIDEGWWREEATSRRYWRVALASGRVVTIFEDMSTEQWYEQRY